MNAQTVEGQPTREQQRKLIRGQRSRQVTRLSSMKAIAEKHTRLAKKKRTKAPKLSPLQTAISQSEYSKLDTPELSERTASEWKGHDKATHDTRLKLGHMFLVLRDKLSKSENGRKGMGFQAWCSRNRVPRRTAYAYIDEWKIAKKLMPEDGGSRKFKYDRDKLLKSFAERVKKVADTIHEQDKEHPSYQTIVGLLVGRVHSALSEFVGEKKPAARAAAA
jgi:hypothetical protein